MDKLYLEKIKPWLKKHKIEFECFEDTTVLPALVEELHSLYSDDTEEEELSDYQQLLNQLLNKKKKRKETPRKLISPDFVFIFDDLYEEIQHNKTLEILMTRNRKYNTAIYIISQYYTHVPKDARANIRMWFLLNGVGENGLKSIWNDACIRLPLNTFISLYREMTKEPFSFISYNTGTKEFKKKFKYAIDI